MRAALAKREKPPIKPANAAVGARVAALRDLANLSQEVFSERIRLSQSGLSAIETGNRNISVVRLYQLAQALDVSPADLVQPIHQTEKDRQISDLVVLFRSQSPELVERWLCALRIIFARELLP